MRNKNIDALWVKFFTTDDETFDSIYHKSYTYDEMKIVSEISTMETFKDLPYEILFLLSYRIYQLWNAAFLNKFKLEPREYDNPIALKIVEADQTYQFSAYINDKNEEIHQSQIYAKHIAYYIIREYNRLMLIK